MNLYMNESTSIYVMTPYLDKGGARSLHQLAFELLKHEFNVFVYYFDKEDANACCCKDLDIPIAKCIEDEQNNIIIIPEQYISYSLKYNSIQKVVWWLSLYFYRSYDPIWHSKFLLAQKGLPEYLFPIYFPLRYIKHIDMYFMNNYKYIDSHLDEYKHMYNCEYAKNYLVKKGIKSENMAYLCGPITSQFVGVGKAYCKSKKEDVITVNPSKVEKQILNKFKKEIEKKSNVKIFEIKGMSPDEVRETLLRTKVYVDLGYFPGPERIPREAVSLYCNIFTSNLGAANNDIDVPISRQYKCDYVHERMDEIADRILDMLDNYEEHVEYFDKYREKVADQVKRFESDIISIFVKKRGLG